jgi:hypothetical protein
MDMKTILFIIICTFCLAWALFTHEFIGVAACLNILVWVITGDFDPESAYTFKKEVADND